MYGDNQNAWPATAPINVFVRERERPKRIGFASRFLLVTASSVMATGLLAFVEHRTEEAGAIGAIPDAVIIGVAAVFALWLIILMRPVSKGRGWSLGTARWSAVALLLGSSAYFVLGAPWIMAEQFGGEPTPTVFISAISAVLALTLFGCLWGRSVREYFHPPAPEMAPGGAAAQPIGNEADWTPTRRPGQRPPQMPRF